MKTAMIMLYMANVNRIKISIVKKSNEMLAIIPPVIAVVIDMLCLPYFLKGDNAMFNALKSL
jgi:hypothetical protein